MSQDIHENPHQPRDFNFPKRCFGQKKVVKRSFQPTSFSQWPFLHYCEAQDVAYCHTCVKAFQQKQMPTAKHSADPAFVSVAMIYCTIYYI